MDVKINQLDGTDARNLAKACVTYQIYMTAKGIRMYMLKKGKQRMTKGS